MNQNHIIDSWIAELGLSGRRIRRGEEAALAPTDTARASREVAAVRADYTLRPRYQGLSSPC